MSNPADNTPGCTVCGLAWQVRGCTPEVCRGGDGFAVVHKPIRTDAAFYGNPGDLFNGHPLSSFCETCRLGILEIGRTERTSVTICSACTAMMMQPSPAPGSVGYAAPVEHPLPWRWTDHNGDALLDGDGRVMLVLAHAGPVAPYVREVTALAPELEAAWREAIDGPGGVDFCGNDELYVRLRVLLARLDAAKAGG